MSKSTKKTQITGHTTHVSEKYDKRLFNRSFRRQVRELIAAHNAQGFDEDMPMLHLPNEISTTYDFDKDGKQYLQLNKFIEQIRKGLLFEIPKTFLDKHLRSVNVDPNNLSEESILSLAKERMRNHMRK